jgi:hypothetical protein
MLFDVYLLPKKIKQTSKQNLHKNFFFFYSLIYNPLKHRKQGLQTVKKHEQHKIPKTKRQTQNNNPHGQDKIRERK